MALKVTQLKSNIGCKPKQRGTLRALGLRGIGRTNTLPDRPEIRGMIARVPHLVSVEEVEEYWHGLAPPFPELFAWAAEGQAPPDMANLPTFRPFMLAHPLEETVVDLADYVAEWKWDGIRGQIILRGGSHFVWSRGEELITDRFPEFAPLSKFLPEGTVLDGEILAWKDEAPLPFNVLQTRIGRKTVSKAVLSKAPAILYAYDLLEWQGKDIRDRPFKERRQLLETLCHSLPNDLPLRLSPSLGFESWTALADIRSIARAHHAEGLMIKNRQSRYEVGRKKGAWWKWKLDPLTIDAVMIYAQAGHGRRANLYTDFTFAVWQGNDLVPFAKAYSGLSDAEFRDITAWVRKNTLQRFGPVRQVTPEHVFEIAFEGIHHSTRHKSGVALRFPRMARWRKDKSPQDANTLEDLKDLLNTYG